MKLLLFYNNSCGISLYICHLLLNLLWVFLCVFYVWNQSYQWLKDKIVSEDGRKQQAKLKELSHIAEKLSCTLPQLAVGETKPQNPHLPRSLVFHRIA